MTTPEPEGNRNALLALHFGDADAQAAAATRAHVEACASCRAYVDRLERVEVGLRAWPDERPPAGLVDRVLARALRPASQAPAPASAASAMPLLALLPVMAALLYAIQEIAGWLPSWEGWPRLVASPALATVAPFGAAALILLALGGLGALAVAPPLVLETVGGARRSARLPR